jgi:hypothetical protein
MKAPAAFLIFCISSVANAATEDIPQIAFLGFQLINTSLEPTTTAEDQRIRILDDLFQQKLEASGRFKILPIPPDLHQEITAGTTAMAVGAIGLERPGRIGLLGAPCRR